MLGNVTIDRTVYYERDDVNDNVRHGEIYE